MSSKDVVWAGGEHAFAFKIEHLRALQDRTDCGPEWLMRRLLTPEWRVDDVCNVIRLGLEGGGMPADDARKLVRVHLEDKPENLKATALVAGMVLMDAIMVEEAGDQGEAKPAVE